MDMPTLDEVDRAVLRALQEDARNNTNAAISERVSVSASTVGKRIARLEERGIVKGHRSEIDYEAAGFPLRVLFVCTAPIAERETLVERTLEIDGVINVRELMTGRENVHVLVVGSSNDDITRVAQTLDGLGYTVSEEILVREEHARPSVSFEDLPYDD